MTVVASERKKISYFKDVKQEMKKVTWTSKEELLLGTKLVVLATFLFSFAIYGVDFAIRTFLNGTSNFFQWIFG